MRFFKNAFKAKVKDVAQDLVTLAVKWDPETASEAEIMDIEEEVDKWGLNMAKAEQELKRERQEDEAIQKTFNEYVAAAEILEAEGDEATLLDVVKKLEELQPEIEREAQETAEAEADYNMMKETFDMMVEKLKTAKSTLDRARKDMERAEANKNRQAMREERAREAAGLASGVSGMNVALQAMQEEAESLNAEARASELKSSSLSAKSGLDSNDKFAAALAKAKGTDEASKGSASDRLAALRGMNK